jgi:hypothetical protein
MARRFWRRLGGFAAVGRTVAEMPTKQRLSGETIQIEQ